MERKVLSEREIIYGEYDAGYPAFGVFRCQDGKTLEGIPDSLHWSLWGVSADGRTIVGQNTSGLGAFKWSEGKGGYVEICPGIAHGVSGNGTVVVGTVVVQNGEDTGFRWTGASGIESLSSPAVGVSEDGTTTVCADGSVIRGGKVVASVGGIPTNISADGTTVIGDLDYTHIFRWTEKDGMEIIPTFNESDYITVRGVSADGSVMAGWFDVLINDYWHTHAFKWDSKAGLVSLGALPIPYENSNAMHAFSVSPDGLVIVGQGIAYKTGGNGTTWVTWRWTEKTGLVSFGDTTGSSGGTSLIAVPTEEIVVYSPINEG